MQHMCESESAVDAGAFFGGARLTRSGSDEQGGRAPLSSRWPASDQNCSPLLARSAAIRLKLLAQLDVVMTDDHGQQIL
jgi:hypothetical protein